VLVAHLSRKVLRCQMGYQKSYIEEGQTIQWPKEKREKGRLFITLQYLNNFFFLLHLRSIVDCYEGELVTITTNR
jgi:hypothetical protein